MLASAPTAITTAARPSRIQWSACPSAWALEEQAVAPFRRGQRFLVGAKDGADPEGRREAHGPEKTRHQQDRADDEAAHGLCDLS